MIQMENEKWKMIYGKSASSVPPERNPLASCPLPLCLVSGYSFHEVFSPPAAIVMKQARRRPSIFSTCLRRVTLALLMIALGCVGISAWGQSQTPEKQQR